MKKKKILVVDNHPIILEYMSKFLSKDGHEVRTSEDGLHALDLLWQHNGATIMESLNAGSQGPVRGR